MPPARSCCRVPELVAEVAAEIVDVVAPGHQDQVAHAGLGEEVDRPLDHRLVPDGQEMLVRDASERVETRPRPACQDNAFHDGDGMQGVAAPNGAMRRP